MTQIVKLPLFPLNHAVLPGEILPLHIFEERYKALVRDCTEHGLGEHANPFGLSLTCPEGIHHIGCTLRITEITNTFPDGRLDILTVAENRCRLDTLIQDHHPYYEAAVEILSVEQEEEVDRDLQKEVQGLHEQLVEVFGEHSSLPRRWSRLSFASALALGLSNDQKQILLALSNENIRLEWLEALYGKMLQLFKRRTFGSPVEEGLAFFVGDPGLKLVH